MKLQYSGERVEVFTSNSVLNYGGNGQLSKTLWSDKFTCQSRIEQEVVQDHSCILSRLSNEGSTNDLMKDSIYPVAVWQLNREVNVTGGPALSRSSRKPTLQVLTDHRKPLAGTTVHDNSPLDLLQILINCRQMEGACKGQRANWMGTLIGQSTSYASIDAQRLGTLSSQISPCFDVGVLFRATSCRSPWTHKMFTCTPPTIQARI